jgi:hypothetical protein
VLIVNHVMRFGLLPCIISFHLGATWVLCILYSFYIIKILHIFLIKFVGQ